MSDRKRRTPPWLAASLKAQPLSALVDLPPTRLWSLLLPVAEERAAQRTPAHVLQQWRTDRFVAPSYIDQRTLLALDRELLENAAEFEAIELSPLAPLAACSAVALTSQKRVLSTMRGSELVADPTNVLALECASRLRTGAQGAIRLATSHRCVRAQSVPPIHGFAAHFRMFCACTGGFETASHGLLISAFVEHVRLQLRGLDRLERCGYAFPDRAITLMSRPERASVAERIVAALPELTVAQNTLEQPYYDGLRFLISVRASDGETLPLIDGGAFDWLATLTANRKAVFVASAIGSQLAALRYRLER